MLRLYCRALSERGLELQDLTQLIEKNIGWSRADVATSDGTAIFLPSVIDRFDGEADNYAFLKVMLTQQAGHIEFGSFEFVFDRPSILFNDLRPDLDRKAERDASHHSHGHGHEEGRPTELTRFFRLFPNKRLARDIFSIVESARVEACVMREYPGIRGAYKAMRERVLGSRQAMLFLPAREALVEYLIRISLGQSGAIMVPTARVETAAKVGQLLRVVIFHDAKVEDTAEATLRIYGLLAPVMNEYLDEDLFTSVVEPFEGVNLSPYWPAKGAAESFVLPQVSR